MPEYYIGHKSKVKEKVKYDSHNFIFSNWEDSYWGLMKGREDQIWIEK